MTPRTRRTPAVGGQGSKGSCGDENQDQSTRALRHTHAALGAFVSPERRARVAGAFDPRVARLRIDRAHEASEHLAWAIAYAVLAYADPIGGIEAIRRLTDALAAGPAAELVAPVIDTMVAA